MVGSRVFLGGLNYRVSEFDIEKFFKGYQGVGDITLKNGYAFVEFEDKREAEDAIYEMNGRDLLGGRVTVEKANERPRDNNRFRGGGAGGGGGGRRGMGGNYSFRGARSGGSNEVKYRLRVTNLSRSVGWRDLKDYMRSAGEVTYADAHRQRQNEGIIDFATVSDMRNAIKKLDGKELRGRNIRLVDEYGHLRRYRSMSRSRSRSRGRRSSMSRSRSRSGSPLRNKRSMSRESRSRSRDRNRGQSRSISPSPRRDSRSDDD